MPAAKLIVSPDVATEIACRSVQLAPGQVPPASAALFTVSVAARPPDALHASAAKPANRIRRLIFNSPRRDASINHTLLQQLKTRLRLRSIRSFPPLQCRP